MAIKNNTDETSILSTQLVKERNYWHEKLSGELVRSSFPYDYIKSVEKERNVGHKSVRINNKIAEKLIKLSNNSDANLHILVVALVTLLIYKYTENEDIVIGTPIYKQELDGEFINTLLPIRNCILIYASFKEFLIQTRKVIAESVENQNYPLEKLLNLLVPPNEKEQVIDVAILMENVQLKKYLDCLDINMLFKFTRNDDNSINVSIEYNKSLYKDTTVSRILNHLSILMSNALQNLDSSVKDLDVLSDQEKLKLLHDFNNTVCTYDKGKTIVELFEEAAYKFPHNIAVTFKTHSLTYSELNNKANFLAQLLRRKGVAPNSIIAIMAERSIEMIIAVLGVLKAGAAFLPIDIKAPRDRVKFMLEQSEARLLLVHGCNGIDKVFDQETIKLDIFNKKQYEICRNLEHNNCDKDLAYIIYTSGTTGKPKGVMIEHGAIYNTISWRKEEYKLDGSDRVLQLFPYCFDGFITSFFTPIVSGSEVIMPDENEAKDPVAIRNYIISKGVTHFICVPTLYNAILGCFSKEDAKSLRVITLAGESVTPVVIRKTRNISDRLEIVNEYGPTENSVASTVFRNMQNCDEVTIGKPIKNTKVHILDQYGRLQPIGVTGEIYLSGDGLARGYLNNPNLTIEKFVDNTFVPGYRMYRTGDMGRWTPDGNIEFLGRNDHQVKVRGFRIELKEIETQLTEHAAIKEAVVLSKEDENGNTSLNAYIVASDNQLSISDIRKYLSLGLPDYMMPTCYYFLECIPVLLNGKVDRNKLSKLEAKPDLEQDYIQPRNYIEESLVKTWQDVLKIERIGIYDNFISLGGDSIKAIKVLSRLNELNLKLGMKDLFQYPVIKDLSQHVTFLDEVIEQGHITGQVELSPIQRWFFENNFTNMNHFNQSIMLYRKEGFDENIIRNVFNKLVSHHDALRMKYSFQNDGIIQICRGIDEEVYTLEVYELENNFNYENEISQITEKVQSSMDLSSGALLKLALFKTNKGDHLLFSIQHLIIDTVSLRILLEDFTVGYTQAVNNTEIKFSSKTTSYKEWTKKLIEYSTSHTLLTEKKYWEKIELSAVESLPTDTKVSERKNKSNRIQQFLLSEHMTNKLLKEANRAYNTNVEEILLTAIGYAVKEWARVNKVLINIESHGREEIIENINITRTIGWFSSAYPLVLDMNYSNDASYQIRSIKESARGVPYKGIGYFILKYMTPEENRKPLTFLLNPKISFNYLGQFDESLETGVFSLSDLNTGTVMSPDNEKFSSIEITALVARRRLSVSINYNTLEYREETISGFVRLLEAHLNTIINHCTGKKETEMTPHDFGDNELTIDELEEVTNLYRNITETEE